MDIGWEKQLLEKARADYAAKTAERSELEKEVLKGRERLFNLARLIVCLSEQINEPVDSKYAQIVKDFRKTASRKKNGVDNQFVP